MPGKCIMGLNEYMSFCRILRDKAFVNMTDLDWGEPGEVSYVNKSNQI
jgi:hypothetical protein